MFFKLAINPAFKTPCSETYTHTLTPRKKKKQFLFHFKHRNSFVPSSYSQKSKFKKEQQVKGIIAI
jgi:hypothetical protein